MDSKEQLRNMSAANKVLVGVMIYTNSFAEFTRILTEYGIGWYVGPDAVAGPL